MARLSKRARTVGVSLLLVVTLGLAVSYGVAQSTLVTQAEWAVYMAQGLGLDWNMPRNPKSNHYLARLEWTKNVDFEASQMLDGSTAKASDDGSIAGAGGASEALYEVAMLRAGDYGFRVKLGGGGAVLKVADQTFDLYQPSEDTRWVDLERVRMSPGNHKLSLMLDGLARADSLGVSPPCMLPVEPTGGWKPLEPLRFDEMAVTLAKALDLEQNLPTIGDPFTVRGESFRKTLVYPFEEQTETAVADEPFWLTSGDSIVTAVARFAVPEKGVYSIDARYISPRPVRWTLDNCLRVITCPVVPSQLGRRRSLALELDAGEHEIEVTMAPGAKLDRIDIQRRDGSSQAYVHVVEDEGFRLGEPNASVLRKDALSAARRLRDRFLKLTAVRCDDTLVAMEAAATARSLQSSQRSETVTVGDGNAPEASAGSSQVTFADPVFPPVGGNDPRVSSPVQP